MLVAAAIVSRSNSATTVEWGIMTSPLLIGDTRTLSRYRGIYIRRWEGTSLVSINTIN